MGIRLYEGMSLREVTDFLFVQDEPGPADLILVVGTRREEKADKAVQLFQAGHAPRILLSGGDKQGTGVADAEEMKKLCLERGVPEPALWLESRSVNTLENVLMSVPLIDAELGWKNMSGILVVASPVKMRRVKQVLARHIPRDVRILCCPDERQDVSRDNWWTTPGGREAVFRELEKVRRYALQGEL